jgi:hypothetical protein
MLVSQRSVSFTTFCRFSRSPASTNDCNRLKSLFQQELNKLRPYKFEAKEGFVSEESAKAMERSRRGRNRKKK